MGILSQQLDQLEFEIPVINFARLAIITAKGGGSVNTFYCKTKILSGPGATVGLKALGSRRLLMVADPYFTKDGTARKIAELSGAEIRIFDKIQPDPSVELAAEGTAVMKEFAPDTVCALGGGSAMDCAKAMVYFSGQEVTLVAIPTTSGSGSEVTNFTVLTHGSTKSPLVDDRLLPDVAILDSGLLRQLPKSLIADCGFDVLAHALEGYVATGGGTMTDVLAREAFAIVYAELPASYGGRQAVRQRLHEASCMAGMAFSQAGLGLCHALSHALGGLFHLPHGRLNAILLPEVVACNAHICQEKYAKLARYAGLGGSADTLAVRNLRNGLIRLRRQLQLPETLAQAGVDPRQLRQQATVITEMTLADPCCKTNPLPVASHMVQGILEAVTGRG